MEQLGLRLVELDDAVERVIIIFVGDEDVVFSSVEVGEFGGKAVIMSGSFRLTLLKKKPILFGFKRFDIFCDARLKQL